MKKLPRSEWADREGMCMRCREFCPVLEPCCPGAGVSWGGNIYLIDEFEEPVTPGTPKSLKEAISNGCSPWEGTVAQAIAKPIYAHTRDFLSQKFGAAMLSPNEQIAQAIKKLWEEVSGEKR